MTNQEQRLREFHNRVRNMVASNFWPDKVSNPTINMIIVMYEEYKKNEAKQ